MKISMVIPAKGHSTRLENKNFYKIRGKSLVEIACERALACETIHDVYLDTESERIIAHVEPLMAKGLKIIKRPKELATNNITANDLMIYALHSMDECDLITQSFATSPLITSKTIDQCIHRFMETEGQYDSFFSVIPVQEYFWTEKTAPANFDPKKLPNSFELDKLYQETHGIYGIFTKKLIQKKTRIGDRPLMVPIPKMQALDINDREDLEILNRILGLNKSSDDQKFNSDSHMYFHINSQEKIDIDDPENYQKLKNSLSYDVQ